MSGSDWVNLSVGGQPFHTTLTTLLSCPGSVLANMFDPESGLEPAHSENGIFYLDSNPKYFGIILDWLRYRKLMADSDTNLYNLAAVAEYFGIWDLVEKIKPVGKWVDFKDLPRHDYVSAMEMVLDDFEDPTLGQIVQAPNGGLQIVKVDQIEELGGRCLALDLKERAPVWIPTVMGKLPAGAIAVQAGEEKMFIGRKFWSEAGLLHDKVKMWYHGDIIVVPHEIKTDGCDVKTKISVGYVNENGIFGITFDAGVSYILKTLQGEWEEEMVNYSTSEFEVLCAF